MPPEGELTAALRRDGIRFVYASHWLSARVKAESRETIGVQESNINVSEGSRTDPDPTELVPLHLENGTGILLGAGADALGIRAALAGQPVAVRETTAGPYPLLVLEPTPPPRRRAKSGWRTSAGEGGDTASRLRFTTKVNFIGCSIGRVVGLAPRDGRQFTSLATLPYD